MILFADRMTAAEYRRRLADGTLEQGGPAPAGERRKRATPERDFQSAVIELAHLGRWKVAHFRPARTAGGGWITPVAADGKGFPDLVLVRDRVLFRELKVAADVTDEQVDWIVALTEAGADAGVWRPDDMPLIEEVLR